MDQWYGYDTLHAISCIKNRIFQKTKIIQTVLAYNI